MEAVATEAAPTLRLETCPSLFSSSSPPRGRTGICLSSSLVCLFTVWLQSEQDKGSGSGFWSHPTGDALIYLRVGSGSFMKVL